MEQVKADYLSMSDEDLARFVQEHAGELDCDDTAAEILALKGLTIERRSFGFAILYFPDKAPFLVILYIDPQHRGRRLGRQFVRELLWKHSGEYHMSLRCYGPRRSRFFSRCGFYVEERSGDCRKMTTNRERR